MKIGNEEIIAKSMASVIEKDKDGNSVFRGYVINTPKKEREVRSFSNKINIILNLSTLVLVFIVNVAPIKAGSIITVIIIAINLAYYYKASSRIINGLEKSINRKSYPERVRERWNNIFKK